MSRAAVISRPGTQGSGRLPTLPAIQHPLSGMAPGPAQIDVTAGNAPASAGRPLANETDYRIPKRLSTAGSRAGETRRRTADPMLYESIPEGIEVKQGDPNKPRMPIFGNRTQIGSREEVQSRASTRLSMASTQSRLEVDELEAIIKEKCRQHFHEVQKKFKDNDPQGVGNVSKDALYRIIQTITGKQISQSVFSRLVTRIGFTDKNMIHFSEFFAKFRIVPNSAYPQTKPEVWMTSISKNFNDRPQLTAIQVHTLLKEKARQRVLDVADLVPQTNPDGARRLLKPEFKNALNKLLFSMTDDEFERLWLKYDEENLGVIDGSKFMKKLGISLADMNKTEIQGLSQNLMNTEPESPPATSKSKKKESERQRSLDIERWLKNKFREGFQKMKERFEQHDSNKSGLVPPTEFCSILSDNGLKLDKSYLDEFLARCGISQTKLGVPYRDFLHRFQDRSEEGMPHKILGDPGHRYNKMSIRTGSPGAQSGLSAVEAGLMNMFQRDFLSLIGTFHKIDRIGQDVISQEEFRAAIESRFGIEMSEEQFRNLIDHVPLNNEGDVKYAEFMAQFDTRGDAKSLFSMTGPKKAPIKSNKNGYDQLVLEDEGHAHRSVEELTHIIKTLVRSMGPTVEIYFSEMNEYSSQRLSQDTLYKLLKRFEIDPVVTRGEIRDLWRSFITNKDGKLEWCQFVRHFGPSLKSATYPNAKLNPPKRGDADFQLRSKKLNSDNDILQDSLRQKIDYHWDDLRKEFFEMDPYGTGCVSKEEFHDVLTELCVQLTNTEVESLVKKFTAADGRVSYIEFLRPFAMKREVWRNGNNMQLLLAHPNRALPISDVVEHPQKGLVGLSAKLRQRLAGDWKNLRRAFKKLDKVGNGLLTLPEFRNVLKLANVIMDEDEVYHVMHTFDEDLSGRINYTKFLSETFRPETRESQRK